MYLITIKKQFHINTNCFLIVSICQLNCFYSYFKKQFLKLFQKRFWKKIKKTVSERISKVLYQKQFHKFFQKQFQKWSKNYHQNNVQSSLPQVDMPSSLRLDFVNSFISLDSFTFNDNNIYYIVFRKVIQFL